MSTAGDLEGSPIVDLLRDPLALASADEQELECARRGPCRPVVLGIERTSGILGAGSATEMNRERILGLGLITLQRSRGP